VNHKITSLISGLIVVLLSVSALAVAASSDDEIRERLRPAGTVCVIGDACAGAVGTVGAAGAAVASGPGGPRNAETIYNAFCMVCHATGISESPILGNAEQWAPRVAKGVDVLYTNSINGINVMPARGTCIDCSDDEMRAVVDFMLGALQ
jgi:cytochrome c5